MEHLTDVQIEEFAEGQAPQFAEHVNSCALCGRNVALARRLAGALARVERAAPSREFAVRLDKRLALVTAQGAVSELSAFLVGLAAFFASLLLLVFIYQTVLGFQQGGVFDFVSLFLSRPDLLAQDPFDALGALLESLPLLQLLFTFGLFVIALVLAQEFTQTLRPSERNIRHSP